MKISCKTLSLLNFIFPSCVLKAPKDVERGSGIVSVGRYYADYCAGGCCADSGALGAVLAWLDRVKWRPKVDWRFFAVPFSRFYALFATRKISRKAKRKTANKNLRHISKLPKNFLYQDDLKSNGHRENDDWIKRNEKSLKNYQSITNQKIFRPDPQ